MILHQWPFSLEEYFQSARNRLITEELSYDREALAEDHAIYFSKFNAGQHHVYNSIISSYWRDIFVYGSSGSRTFLWSALSVAVSSKGEIVLNVAYVASSEITSLFLPGGKTVILGLKLHQV